MKADERNIALTSYDDIFKNEETRKSKKLERVQLIPADQMKWTGLKNNIRQAAEERI